MMTEVRSGVTLWWDTEQEGEEDFRGAGTALYLNLHLYLGLDVGITQDHLCEKSSSLLKISVFYSMYVIHQ